MKLFEHLLAPLLGYVGVVAVVILLTYGNPFALSGAKLQEFAGYVVGLLLSALVLTVVMSQLVMTSHSPSEARPPQE